MLVFLVVFFVALVVFLLVLVDVLVFEEDFFVSLPKNAFLAKQRYVV